MSRNGIANIEFRDSNIRGNYGLFKIDGKPSEVDKLMIEIGEWLKTCQKMYFNL